MKTRNAMQLKDLIKSRSIEIGLTPQQALHAYYMECFVNRLAHSDYLDNFVLKGGYLISNLIGFESRTTMDVTAGDSIYPGVQQMFFKRNFDKSLIRAWSYPVETVLAEKLETIITRSILNKRPRYAKAEVMRKEINL